MNKFVYRALCENYERTSLLMIAEIRRGRTEVTASNVIGNEFKESLALLRQFLDNCGYPMPKPKWQYNDKDQSTWLFTPQKQLNKSFHMLQSRRR